MMSEKFPVDRGFAVAPSLMCADMLELRHELRLFEEGRIEFLHMDVMDGRYVPNLALGPQVCEQVSAACRIPQDIHLMVEEVDNVVPMFVEAGPRFMTFHPEASRHPVRTIQRIRDAGIDPGIAVDPWVPIESIELLLGEVALVCVMTVNPGYASQRLIPWTLDKVEKLAERRESMGHDFLIEVDGNASWENIPRMVGAGAQIVVAGTSSLFDSSMSREEAIARMNSMRFGGDAL